MSDFERLVLGEGGGAEPGGVPSFLRDDSDAKDDLPDFLKGGAGHGSSSGGGAPPSFLDDFTKDVGAPAPGAASPVAGSRPSTALDGPAAATATVLSSAEQLDFVGDQQHHWRLQRQRILGKGNFGCATLYGWSAPQHGDGALPSQVVVKDINIQTMQQREEEMKGVETEVRVLRCAVGHPGLVQFLDFHHASAALMMYLVLEYCGGGDLGDAIETARHDRRPLEEDFIASMLIQVMAGLNYLHTEQRVLHRDMKPQNVFLLADGVTARIGDFGIATFLDQVGGQAKEACGSYYYMAPEVCEERAYGGGADVWSAGVMLYELIALERPFEASSIPALAQLVTKGKCVPLPERRELGRYSKELKDLVQSMLTVSDAARPTIRRILRSRYVREHLFCVPAAVLQTSYYAELFGEAEVAAALPKCVHRGTPLVPATAVPRAPAAAAAVHTDDAYDDDYEDDFESDVE